MPRYRSFVPTELVTLWGEESARKLGVLDVDGEKEKVGVTSATQTYTQFAAEARVEHRRSACGEEIIGEDLPWLAASRPTIHASDRYIFLQIDQIDHLDVPGSS